ncbi:MAG: pilus assembly protein N-terminal domain-containing protein [Pseudomonadota bacterium]
MISASAAVLSTGALAQEAAENAQPPIDILPATQAEEKGHIYDEGAHTHPPLKVTPDKSELIRLDKAAGSIIVGNPNHISVLADTAQTLVVIPRAPGATHFTVLHKDGSIVMQRHVIVASPKEKYLRVRRSCVGQDSDKCQQTSVFYCPDMCHEIILGGQEADASSGADDAAVDASGGGSAGGPSENGGSPADNNLE